MQPSEEIHRLVDALTAAPVVGQREGMKRVFIEARDLADHNEWGVALELLCDSLYEYEVPLSRKQYDTIKRLATSWGIDRSYVDPLKELLTAEGAA